MNALKPNIDRRIDAKLRTAHDHADACWRNIQRHLAACDACWRDHALDHGAGVACDDGRLVRGEWEKAIARVVELRRRRHNGPHLVRAPKALTTGE